MGITTATETPTNRSRNIRPTTGVHYVKPQDMAWKPTQFDGISIKVLYEDEAKG